MPPLAPHSGFTQKLDTIQRTAPDRLDAILAPFVLMCLFVRPLGGRCHRERRKREVVSVSTSIPLSLATLSWKRQV